MAVIGETNISMSTVRDTLNEAGGSVGNDLTSFFSANAKLNMWSKFKPMVINLPFINLWDKRDSTRYYYQGADGKCGLSYNEYTQVETFKKALVEGKTKWSYNPPTGGENAPMRLGDFRRYNTSAINPVGNIPANLIATRSASDGDSVQIDLEVKVPTGTSHNLGVSDFHVNETTPFSDMYMGVYLVSSSNVGRFRTSSNKVGTNGVLSIKFPLNNSEGGTYTAYTFLSTTTQSGTDQVGRFVSIGSTASSGVGQIVKIQPAGTLYTITAQAYVQSVGGKTFNYHVVLYNNNTSSTTFKNVYVRIQHYIDGTWQNEGNPVLVTSSKLVSANSNAEIEGTGTHSVAFNLNDLENGKFRIYAYSETPSITGDPSYIEAPVPEG